jgi:hypothetical protein
MTMDTTEKGFLLLFFFPKFHKSFNNNQYVVVIQIINRSLDHLAMTTLVQAEGASLVLAPSSPEQANLIVVELVAIDKRKVVVLRPQKTSTPEQRQR